MGQKFFYGYYIVAAGSIIQMIYLGAVYTFGVLFPEFENEFGWSRTVISGAPSLFFLTFGIFGIAVGIATDRYGPRITLSICGALFGLGFILLYHVSTPWELYLFYGLISGIGMAAHEVATLSTIARWFKKQRGLMSGLVKAGSGIGQATIPLIAASLILDIGWRESCLIIGIFSTIIIVGAAQFFKQDPKLIGLQAFGEETKLEETSIRKIKKISVKDTVRNKNFWILAVCKFCDMFCLFTIITHIVSHGIDTGFERNIAVLILAAIGGFSIFGRIVFGAIYDYLGAQKSLMICFTVLLTSFIILQNAQDLIFLSIFALIYGFAHGGFFAIASPSAADYFGIKSHGMVFGLILFFGTLGGTLGPIIAGKIFDMTKTYENAFIILTIISIIGVLLASRLPRKNAINI